MCEQKLSVFSADYWRAARRELNNPRVLAFSGLVCAMAIVLESLPIYLLGPSLKFTSASSPSRWAACATAPSSA